MDLWILCAEKSNLIKVDNVYIEEFYDREMTHYYEIRTKKDDDEICLGCFETKERAKEVIGEIQALLSPRVFINDTLPVRENRDGYLYLTSTEGNISTYHCSSYVFEMPKE